MAHRVNFASPEEPLTQCFARMLVILISVMPLETMAVTVLLLTIDPNPDLLFVVTSDSSIVRVVCRAT